MSNIAERLRTIGCKVEHLKDSDFDFVIEGGDINGLPPHDYYSFIDAQRCNAHYDSFGLNLEVKAVLDHYHAVVRWVAPFRLGVLVPCVN